MAETDRYAIGLEYTMSVTLTPLVPKDEQGKPVVTEKIYLDGLSVSYIDSGPVEVTVENRRTGSTEVRAIRSDYGIPLGEYLIGTTLPLDRVYTETGRRLMFPRGRSEDINLKLSTSSHLGTRIAAVSQRGMVTP